MDKQKFIETIQSIGTCENDVDRRSMLTDLQDEITKVYDSIETDKTTLNTLNETIKSKDEEISNLQKANMDYFTRLSATKAEQKGSSGDILIPEEPEKRKFEDLFDEKGMIK